MGFNISQFGGNGTPVDGMVALTTSEELYVAPDLTEWLRSGIRSDDISSYPDASRSIADLTGISLIQSAISGDTASDFTYYNGFLWVLFKTLQVVRKYNLDGTYEGTEIDISANTSAPDCITYGGGFFWILDTTLDQSLKFTSDFTFIDGIATGLTVAVDTAYFDGLYGVQTGTKLMDALSGRGAPSDFTLPVPTSTKGVDYRGGFFYAIGDDDIVYQVDRLKGATGVELDMSATFTNAIGITTDGESIWILNSNRDLYEVTTTLAVGTDIESKIPVGLKENSSASGLAIEHMYVRLK